MLEKLRQFFRTPAGMAVAGVLVLGGMVLAFTMARGVFISEAAMLSNDRMFIDTKTGQAYPHTLRAGSMVPAKAPSGGMTGYPAEECYWTKDGKPKSTPTYVLLNLYKGVNEPTFCPDCGRLVVGRNPRPGEGVSPPPTKQEYTTSARGSGSRR